VRTQCRTPRSVRRDSRERPATSATPAWFDLVGLKVVRQPERRRYEGAQCRRASYTAPGGASPTTLFIFQMTDADDYSAACDDLADLGLTEDQIDDVWRWHRITARRQAQTAGGVAIVRLLTYMLNGHKDSNLHLRLVGLAFGVGMGHITGHEHQAAAAHALGVSRQAVADAGERARKAILG
jgi:hypothetical protein